MKQTLHNIANRKPIFSIRKLTLILALLCSCTAVCAQSLHVSDYATERTIPIDFRIGSWSIDSTFSNNKKSLSELQTLLHEVDANPLMRLDSLKISGFASPDGSLPKNKELSLRRAVSLYKYLHNNCSVPDSLMRYETTTVAWGMLRDILVSSDYSWRDEAIRILCIGNDDNSADSRKRMRRLKTLANGEAWKVLANEILPRLRSAFVITGTVTLCQTENDVEIRVSPQEHSDTIVIDSKSIFEPAPAVSLPYADFASRQNDFDRFCIKMNALYLTAGVTNLGVEMALSDRWSIDLPLVYSPYTLARTYRMRFLYIQPEARFWIKGPLKGHFVGVHAHIGVANVSFNRDNRFQTPDGFYGGGISYGYSLPLSRRWSMEFSAGVGYFFTKYDTYHNTGIPTGQRHKQGTPLNYWGIDKLAVNFVYRFGDKCVTRRKEAEP